MIRISLALTCVVLCVYFGAHSLGLIPDAEQAVQQVRGKWCEQVGMDCASHLQRGDDQGLRALMASFVQRHEEVFYAALRTSDNVLVFKTGDRPEGPETSTSQQVIPLFLNGQRWGQLEVGFAVAGFGWLGLEPFWWLMIALALVTFTASYSYLRIVLRFSQKSGAMGDRVRAMLDTLAEGVVILDKEQRIALANKAFTAKVGKAADELIGAKVNELPWYQDNTDEGKELPWQKAINTRATRVGTQLKLLQPQGACNFSVNSSPVLTDKGECKGIQREDHRGCGRLGSSCAKRPEPAADRRRQDSRSFQQGRRGRTLRS